MSPGSLTLELRLTLLFVDSACDAQAGSEIFEFLAHLVNSTPRAASFPDSFTFSMIDSKIVFVNKMVIAGNSQHVRWKAYSREFDDAHGIEHIPLLQDRANKAAKKKQKPTAQT